MPAVPRSTTMTATTLALLLAAPAHAVVGLTGSALEAKDASGNSIPTANLQISLLGNDGKDVEYNVQTDERGQVPIKYIDDADWDPNNAWDGESLSLGTGPNFGSILYEGDADGNGAYRQDFSIIEGDMYSVGVGLGYVLDDQFAVRYDYDYDDKVPDSPSTGVLDPNSRYTFTSPQSCSESSALLDNSLFNGARTGDTPYGCQVSVPGGPDPAPLMTLLQGLEAKGEITDVEKDYCVEFLPRGGIRDGGPDEPLMLATVDVSVSDFGLGGDVNGGGYGGYQDANVGIDFSGNVMEPWGLQPIDAAVSVNPLSPLPNFDPGERDGDWELPSLGWSGDDGDWNIKLNYNFQEEPVEINYATRWASTSVTSLPDTPVIGNLFKSRARDFEDDIELTILIRPQIVGFSTPHGTSGSSTATTTNGGGTTPPENASVPEEKKPEGNVCGPDVTDYMLKNIEYMEQKYNEWSEAEKDRRCVDLFSVVGTDGALFKFNYSWDMIGFAPSDGGDTNDPNKAGYLETIFLMSAAPGWCATPRNPCGRTAEFAGYCVDVQIMNYLQWGAMTQLCDVSIMQRMAHAARKVVFRTPALIADQQSAFSKMGEYLARESRGHDFTMRVTKRLADLYFGETEGFDGRPASACALECDQARAEPGLQNREWGFRWGGNRLDDRDRFPRRGSELIKR